jgi:hypothetical protein
MTHAHVRCAAQTKAGAPCRMARLTGQKRCFTHSAGTAGHRRAARVKGGKATRQAKASAPVPVLTIAQLQGHLGLLLADVLLLPNTERRASAGARLIMAAARLITDGETRDLLEQVRDELTQLRAQGIA